MQTKNILLCLIFLTGLIISSCEKFLEPDPVQISTEERFLKEAGYAEGILVNAYRNLPNSYSLDERASDDAVSNNVRDEYRRMATGEWTSQYSPISNWDDAYTNLYYINFFLSLADKVEWSWESPLRHELFKKRLTGEAYGLRAWYNFELLKRHGGKAKDGSMKGIILLDKPLTKDSDWSIARSSYDDCVQAIYADIDRAISMLPFDYVNTSDVDSTRVLGDWNEGRISGRILTALKSRVALHVASQAFSPSTAKWEAAADAAAVLLKDIGGVSGLAAAGRTFYLANDNADILWRRDVQQLNSWERDNFPPSLFGNGRTNPSQNLVDAFPMINGYPINNAASGYDPANPYKDRDPRLTDYIVYSGSKIGSATINTNTEDPSNGLNSLITSTRTGYYLKKLLRDNVNLAPDIDSRQEHFYTLFRYTELFLNYAEAANEAWGPTGDPRGNGFNASTIIAAIRERAGITQPDAYLGTVTSQADMRQLIRNERRIELCFEGFRFWDLRRWDLPLDEKIKGVSITNNVYTVIDVEERSYKSHMKYGPIPYLEILKNKSLDQNEGW